LNFLLKGNRSVDDNLPQFEMLGLRDPNVVMEVFAGPDTENFATFGLTSTDTTNGYFNENVFMSSDIFGNNIGGVEVRDSLGNTNAAIYGDGVIVSTDGLISLNRSSDGQSAINMFQDSGNGGLSIQDNTNQGRLFFEAGTGDLVIRDSGGLNRIELVGSSGEIFADSITAVLVTQTSDKRLKTNITALNNSLSNVRKLNGVSYYWNEHAREYKNFNTESKQIGLIAQEVESMYPEAVSTNKDGYKSVNYSSLVSVLIEAIKELDQKVTDLQEENSELKAELARSGTSDIEKLKAEIAEIKALISQSSNLGN
jgi:hypothetical protein